MVGAWTEAGRLVQRRASLARSEVCWRSMSDRWDFYEDRAFRKPFASSHSAAYHFKASGVALLILSHGPLDSGLVVHECLCARCIRHQPLYAKTTRVSPQ